MTAAPPWVLAWPVVTVTRPQPAAIRVTLPPRADTIIVRWPPRQVRQPCLPPAPRVIRLPAPPQGMQRVGIVRLWSPPSRTRAAAAHPPR